MTSSESVCKTIKIVQFLSDDITAWFWVIQQLVQFSQSWTIKSRKKKKKKRILQREFRADRPELYFDPIKKKNQKNQKNSKKLKKIQLRGICNRRGLQIAILFSDRQLEAQVFRIRGSQRRKGPLLHLVGSVRFVLLDDGQRVSLGVKDPVVER